MSLPAPEVCSCSALRQAARHMTRHYDAALAPTGLGLNQYTILARLARHGEKSLQDLADILVMDRSTLGHLLRPLQERGLLKIGVGLHDRRRRVIALTPAGTILLNEARPMWDSAERLFVSRFGADRAMSLRAVLKDVERVSFEHEGGNA